MVLMMPLTWKLLRKATDDIDNLTQQVQKIHTILKQFDDLDTDKMKAVDAFAKGIGLMNISLSVAAATSPLAYVGLVAVLGEMSLISKIVGKINDIDASKETHQKMKDVAILITACAGVMTMSLLTPCRWAWWPMRPFPTVSRTLPYSWYVPAGSTDACFRTSRRCTRRRS